MASRGGIGTGVGITIALLGVIALGSTVLAFVFGARMSKATAEAVELKTSQAQYVTDAEKNNDGVQALVREAQRANSGSLVAYMQRQFRAVSEKVTGSPGETPDSLNKKITDMVGGDGNVVRALDSLRAQVEAQKAAVAGAEAARRKAGEDLAAAQDKNKAADDARNAALAAIGTDVQGYRQSVETHRADLNSQQQNAAGAVEKVRRDSTDEIARLNDQIARLREENQVAQGKIKSLQQERSAETLRPQDEATLVDGTVLATVDADGSVYINRGRADRIVLGMTFEVYGEANQIQLNAAGEYPRGKASIEIVRVDQNSSTGRVIRSTRGNPVAKGDSIANALYDPYKKYAFLVYGNFDADGDGRSTPEEAGEIKAIVSGWGGKLVDSLSGEVDFLVLGSRPVTPPQPGADAPVAVVQEFIRLRNIAREYDRLFEQAAATSIPVLNENRLRTLIGR